MKYTAIGLRYLAGALLLALSGALGCQGGATAEVDAGPIDATPGDMLPDSAPDAAPEDPAQPPPLPWAAHPLLRSGPLVIAHRGGRMLGPECTLSTYQRAWAAGADVLEADVHLTADGAVVVMHDREVDRTTDGTGAIAEMTLDQIKALDAGYHYAPDDGFPQRGMGLGVPTLDELLSALPDAPLSLEIKQDDPPMVDALLAVLDAHDARGRVLVAAYSDATIQALRAAAPDVVTAMAFDEVIGWITLPPGPDAGPWQPTGHAFQVPVAQSGLELVTAATVEHAHRHGVVMHPYTINDPDEMAALVELGVDGLITDDPVTLRALIDGR